MCGKGSNTTTTQQQQLQNGQQSSTSTPSAAAMAAYQQLLARGQDVASTAYNPYGGEMVAPVNAQQMQGIGGINANAQFASPFIGAATNYAMQGANPISGGDISRYLNPFTQDVVNSTQAQFANQNAQQLQQVKGNAAMQGALGGDREAVAEAETTRQQNLAQNPVIARLYSSGFNTALSAAQAQQQAAAQAAYSIGNLGISGQNAALQGANAQIGAGSLMQSTQNAQDQAAYQQYLAAQGFPYQQTQWLAGLTSGIGGQMGGTTSGTNSTYGTSYGTKTGAPPNQAAQWAGLGIAGAGMLWPSSNQSGTGAPSGSAAGGRIPRRADGGIAIPYGGSSFIPNMPLTAHAPQFPTLNNSQMNMSQPEGQSQGQPQSQGNPMQMASSAMDLAKKIKGSMGGSSQPSPGDYGGSPETNPNLMPMGEADAMGGEAAPIGLVGEEAAGTGLADAGIGAAEAGAGEAAAGGIGDLLPLLLLAKRGGRINSAGGAVDNGIFVRSYDGGGTVTPEIDATDITLNGDALGLGRPVDWGNRETAPARVAQGQPALPPEITQGRSAGIGTGEVPSSGLAFAPRDEELNARPTASAAPAARQSSGIGAGLLSSDAKMGLIAAGLGMMASRSPFLGTAIGEGGLAGIQTYSDLQKQRVAQQEKAADRTIRQQSVDQAAQRLSQEAKQHADDIALRTKAQSETSKQHEFDRLKPQIMTDYDTGKQYMVVRDPKAPGGFRTVDPNELRQPTPQGPAGTPSSPAPSIAPAPSVTPDASIPSSPNNASVKPTRVASLDSGIIPAHTQLLQEGPYNYATGAPYIEKGMDVPQPKEVSSKSATTLKTDAEYYLQTGKPPPISRGNSPVAIMQNKYRDAVMNYGNALAQSRGMTPQEVADAWRSSPGMLRYILGADGRATVSLGTAVRHLDTLQEYAKAWAAKDQQTINRLSAVISREFGGTAATNLETVAHIVGPEIIKAIGIAGGGTAGDREGATNQFTTARSLDQVLGAVTVTQKLLGGQLEGKKKQAAEAGVDEARFKRLIGDRPYDLLTHIDKGGGTAAPSAPVAPRQPTSVPQGSQYSPSRKQWRSPDGVLFDERGNQLGT